MFDSVKIRIKGSFAFLVNFFIHRNIKIYKPRESEGFFTCYIKGKEKDKAFSEIRQKFGDCEILEDRTLKSFFKRNLKRIGLFAGLGVALILISLLSLCTTNLSIKGNKEVMTELIEQTILDFYEIPNFNKELDSKELIKRLILLDGISSASVEKRGNTVFVEVYEELQKVPIVDKTEYTDIVSKYDAIITRIVSFSGTGVKKVDDVVKKGDVLIESKIKVGEDLTMDTYANGEVYGRVCIQKEIIIPSTVMTNVRTGNTYSVYKYFGAKPKNANIPFENYETEIYSVVLDNTFCLEAKKYVYYELETAEKETDFDNNEEFYVRDYTDKYMSELPENSEFLRSWYDVKRLDKSVCLVIYYEIETKIH